MVIFLDEGPSGLWTKGFVGLYGENLRRQRLPFISLTDTPPHGGAVV
jgi:hypothetical protein